METFKLTEEQENIREAFMTGEDIVVTAGAGAAKTTTCKVISGDTKDRGSYIAYNAAIAAEAKSTFPKNVLCKTSHGFAMGPVGRQYNHKINTTKPTTKQIAKFLDAKIFKLPSDVVIAPWAIARLAMDTVQRFCYSADHEITKYHVPVMPGADEVRNELAEFTIPYARKIWADYLKKEGHFINWGRSHDPYLKMAQLQGITLPGEFFMLDEAQDTNPCSQDIFEKQEGQHIAVGDANQQIYGWRGAEDYMTKMKAKHHLTLSQSFRFGPAVAEEANKWLELLNAELRIKGFDQIDSEVVALDNPDAVLCRTNSEIIAQAMQFGEQGKTIAVVGGTDQIKWMAESAIALQSGQSASHPDLIAFKNWGEVKEFVAEEGGDLQVFVRLIDNYGAATVLRVAETAIGEKYADVTLSTAHKAKGREWNSVKIGNDFQSPQVDEETGEEKELSRAEMMLAYVSVTRAKNQLDRGSLDWIDKYLPNGNQTKDIDNPPLSKHPEVENG